VLSRFDDFPIHQTPDPISTPATGEKDFYERYWFNGYSKAGDMYLGVGTARYPHLGIQDCGISIVHNGVQHAFHASARANPEPSELSVGPFNLEVTDPMRACRVVLAPNDTDFTADLTFEARTAAVEEPRHHWSDGSRRIMDTTRFTQFGRWQGWIEYDGQRMEIDRTETYGTKDRSWGVRPVAGGDNRGAPQPPQAMGLFFLWAPLHWDDMCSHYQLFEDTLGRPRFHVGAFLPVYDSLADNPGVEDPGVEPMHRLEHQLEFEPGSRMIKSATLAMTSLEDGARHEIAFEKQFTYRMKGIGYSHPTWPHGAWKGELAMAAERWKLADVDDSAFENQHVQHLMKVRMGDRRGVGVLEQSIFGPYRPYGLEGHIAPSD